MRKGLISIIVPIYKVEDILDRCMKSIMNQTYNNLEIILVDDGSPDQCPIMCDEYAKQDGRVKVIHKKNGGLSDARNSGLRMASGEYVMYIDSDDYIDLDSCERLINATDGKSVDIVVGNAIMEKPNGREMMFHSATPAGKIYGSKEFIIKAIRAHQWYAPACFNMYRREYLLDNDLYFKQGIYFEDMQMLPRVFLLAQKITCIDAFFYHYVVRENSIMTSNKDEKKKNDSFQNLREWKDWFDAINDEKLKKYLYGMLIKCYLHECRIYGIKSWMIDKIDFRFAWRYGLNLKEKIKALVFNFFPSLYVKL